MNNHPVYSMRTPISSSLPKIVVIGLGGGGCNAINRMIENGMQGVTFVACNTDAQALAHNLSPNKVQLGPKSTRGLGAGGLPSVGETAAEESYRELASSMEGPEMVFLTAGMAAGTGNRRDSVARHARVAKASWRRGNHRNRHPPILVRAGSAPKELRSRPRKAASVYGHVDRYPER